MSSQKSIWIILYFIVAVIHLLALFFSQQLLVYITKPLLMILLGVYFFRQNRPDTTFWKFMLTGLFFAFAGDVFLMIRTNEATATWFFLAGIGSFLITQLCYLFGFLNITSSGSIRQKPWLALPFILFFIGFTGFLWPDLPKDLSIAVVVYSLVITGMAIACVNLYQQIPANIFIPLLVGVCLFLISDSMIAISQFKTEIAIIPFASVWIMLTYILAQFLIVRSGVAWLSENSKTI